MVGDTVHNLSKHSKVFCNTYASHILFTFPPDKGSYWFYILSILNNSTKTECSYFFDILASFKSANITSLELPTHIAFLFFLKSYLIFIYVCLCVHVCVFLCVCVNVSTLYVQLPTEATKRCKIHLGWNCRWLQAALMCGLRSKFRSSITAASAVKHWLEPLFQSQQFCFEFLSYLYTVFWSSSTNLHFHNLYDFCVPTASEKIHIFDNNHLGSMK